MCGGVSGFAPLKWNWFYHPRAGSSGTIPLGESSFAESAGAFASTIATSSSSIALMS